MPSSVRRLLFQVVRHPRPRPPAFARSLCLLAGLTLATGCADINRIDTEVDRLVASRSEALGGDAPPPVIHKPSPDSAIESDRYRKVPASLNPRAQDIEFLKSDPSPEAVLDRLDSYTRMPEDAQQMTLELALEHAQRTSREFITAEEEYILAAIRLLIEKHRWGPRLFDDITSTLDAPGDNGDFNTALSVMNELRLTQRLPYGGEVEARLITRATQQLANAVGDDFTQSSSLLLSANIPLLRNAGLIAQEDLIQSERELIYAARSFENFRRALFVDIARDYFSLLAQESLIRNSEERLRSIVRLLERTRALVEAGREPSFQAKNIEQNVLNSRNSLISQRETYLLSLDRFKIRLGLPVQNSYTLDPVSLELDDPAVTVEQAAELALRYRLDYQTRIDQIDDARRGVANSRNQLLPDLNTVLSAAFNTEDTNQVGGLGFDLNDADWRAAVTFGLPLDREIERLQLRTSMIQLERSRRDLDEFRDTLILDARRAVREIDRARFSLQLQEQAVKINELRLEENRIKEDEVDIQTRLDAENELLQTRNSRDQALRDLRTNILEYLRITGQLRVRRDGRIVPLGGMEVRMIGPSDPPPTPTTPTTPTTTPPPENPEPPGSAPPPDANEPNRGNSDR